MFDMVAGMNIKVLLRSGNRLIPLRKAKGLAYRSKDVAVSPGTSLLRVAFFAVETYVQYNTFVHTI